MPAAVLHSVHVGRVAPLGPNNVPSGFVKTPVAGPVAVGALGLAGDEQADHSVHGGPDKALYGYAVANYDAWRQDFPEHGALFAPGAVGENLAIDGMQETDICVGDVHAIGSALLQVCQPRQPCFKFSLRFDDDRLPHAMVMNGRAGWYYRVLREGEVRAGDTIALVERPNPDFSLVRLIELVNRRRHATAEEVDRLAEMPGLARHLQVSIRRQARRSPP